MMVQQDYTAETFWTQAIYSQWSHMLALIYLFLSYCWYINIMQDVYENNPLLSPPARMLIFLLLPYFLPQ